MNSGHYSYPSRSNIRILITIVLLIMLFTMYIDLLASIDITKYKEFILLSAISYSTFQDYILSTIPIVIHALKQTGCRCRIVLNLR